MYYLYSGKNVDLKLSSSVLEVTTECKLVNMARYHADFRRDLCVGPIVNQMTQVKTRNG